MKMKKLVSLLLAVITVFSMLQVTASAETRGPLEPDLGPDFYDVPEDHWAFNAVRWAVKSHVTDGVGDNLFGMGGTVNRAQAVTFLWAYYGSPDPKTNNSPFIDVKRNHWFYKAVLWAVENGITAGTGDNKFSPTNKCTNVEIITMIYAMAGKPAVSGVLNPYSNVSKKAYYYNALMWCIKKNLFDSIPSGYYEKDDGDGLRAAKKEFYNGECKREFIVALLYNYNFSFSKDIDLKSSVIRMMTTAEEEKGNTDRSKYGTSLSWCAAFVSWCAKEAGLASSEWSDPSDTYQYPVLRNRLCTSIGTQFCKNGGLFVTGFKPDHPTDAEQESCNNGTYYKYLRSAWEHATKVTDSKGNLTFIPRKGDIVIFYSDECKCGHCKGRDITHIGIVKDVTPKGGDCYEIKTIEGNTSGDKVAGITYTVNLKTGKTQKNSGNCKYMAAFGRIR